MIPFLKNILTETFGLKFPKTAKMVHLQNTPVFDKKYTTVIDFPSAPNDIEKIMWLHEHAARKSVDIQVVDGNVYIAFEDDSDALIFRIKFL